MELTQRATFRPGEATTLANEFAEAGARLRRFHAKYHDPDDPERTEFAYFMDPERATEEAIERLDSAPGECLIWADFDRVAEVDHDRMLAGWTRTCEEAASEFATGHRAAKVLEPVRMPWARAQFLALREAFRDEWQPRGGIEESMIDSMAQAYTQYEFWLRMLTERSRAMAVPERKQLDKYCQWSPPEQDAADAVEQAGAMAERFHRLYLRTIRAMRDYRRYSGPVFVQSAGQVNVGGQQLNLTERSPQR